ncbi:hypothetical protein [Caldimonas brevitalea]|nr:hypothetical protein [Caldimonas brevitalea]
MSVRCSSRRLAAALAAQLLLVSALAAWRPAQAHPGASDASVLSALPVAVSVAAPAVVLSAGAALTVVAVEASAAGTVWVLERASDGARASVKLAGGASLAVGTAVTVVALSAGWVLSAAGRAIAFIPNEIGAALLYDQRLTR